MSTLTVYCHPKNTLINTNDIVWLEGSGNYTIFHIIDGRNFLTSKSLIYYEELLSFPFVRTHKSCLINIHHVLQRKTAYSINMADGSDVPVARRKRPEMNKYFIFLRKCRAYSKRAFTLPVGT